MAFTAEELKERRDLRKTIRNAKKRQAIILAEKNQNPVKTLQISIEWTKSRTWGSNPHAEAFVRFHDNTTDRLSGFTCSGCGYDKESTVIADIFNHYLKYKLWRFPLFYFACDTNKPPYGVNAGIIDTEEYRLYAGGVGTSCYYAISQFIGGRFNHIAGSKTFDVYEYIDGVKS